MKLDGGTPGLESKNSELFLREDWERIRGKREMANHGGKNKDIDVSMTPRRVQLSVASWYQRRRCDGGG